MPHGRRSALDCGAFVANRCVCDAHRRVHHAHRACGRRRSFHLLRDILFCAHSALKTFTAQLMPLCAARVQLSDGDNSTCLLLETTFDRRQRRRIIVPRAHYVFILNACAFFVSLCSSVALSNGHYQCFCLRTWLLCVRRHTHTNKCAKMTPRRVDARRVRSC